MNILENLPEDIKKKIFIDYGFKKRSGYWMSQIDKKRIQLFNELYEIIPKYYTTITKESTLVIRIKNTSKRILYASDCEKTGYIYKIYENGTIVANSL